MTDIEPEGEKQAGILFPAIYFGAFLALLLVTTVNTFSVYLPVESAETGTKSAKDLDLENLQRSLIYAESGLAEVKSRILRQWTKEKAAPRQLKFSRRMGASFAGGHDEFSVTLQQKENNRYQIVSEGTLYIGTQSRYSGQLAKDENRPSSKRASCKIVTEFDFKDGKFSKETQVSKTDWLPDSPKK